MVDLERLRKLLTPGASLRDEEPLAREKTRSPEKAAAVSQKPRRKEKVIFVAVASRENYLICREKRIYAVKRPTQLARVQKGDIFVFYVTKTSQFPGIYEVVREVYSAGKSPFDSPFYRYHVDLKPIAELPEEKWIKLSNIKDRLDAVKDKAVPPGKFFQTILRTLEEKDYKLILRVMISKKSSGLAR